MTIIIGVFTASCQNDWLSELINPVVEADFVLNVSVPKDITRAAGTNSALGAIGNVSLDEYDIRYILEVYDANGVIVSKTLVNYEDAALSTSFSLRLALGRKYTFAVWADFVMQGEKGDYHYITTNGLRNIEINYTNYNAMDESCDAYTGISVIDSSTNVSTFDIELHRPFAKLRVVTNDINKMVNITPSSATVSYTSDSFYTKFDAYTSDVKGEPVLLNQARVVDLTKKCYSNEPNPAENGVMTLYADYLFAKRMEAGVNFTMDIIGADGESIRMVEFDTEIPIKRNCLTTISGSILTDLFKVGIIITPEFDDESESESPSDNNEQNMVIRYTAADKCEDYFWDYNTFGTNIVSHVFSDGEGVITFDREVTKIGCCAFSHCENLTSITIPNSVTTIDEWAFELCYNLTEFTIPNSVKIIGEGAFYHCTNITDINIPDGVTTIGCYAFAGSSISSITIPSAMTSIDGLFAGCNNLTSVVIPDNITTIGNDSFSWCENLKSVIIPESVTAIGEYAFNCCTSLTDLDIPESVIEIGSWAFCGCCSLMNVTIPESVVTIEQGVFCDCIGLTSVTIPESVTTISNYAFCGCCSLMNVAIPESVAVIGDSAFSSCSNLIEVVIPYSVTRIKDCTFSDCENLTSVTIPKSVTWIGNGAFRMCSSLAIVTIPDSVTVIDSYAFADCYNLTSITIPDSVTTLGDSVFMYCNRLTSVYCKAVTPPVAKLEYGYWTTFEANASNRKIYVPMESVEAYKSAEGWRDYADAIVGYDF